MNAQEVAALLAKVQLDDNREVTRQVVIRWTEILEPITATLDELLEAVNLHRRESIAYLQPAHIVANLRLIRDARVKNRVLDEDDRPPTFVPDPKPANFDAMTAAWNDPTQFAIEVAIYRQQCREYHAARTARQADAA